MLRIKWLGQSGYIIKDENTEICIDPYLSNSVYKVAKRQRLREIPIMTKDLKSNVIICTHNHLDHLDTDTIKEIEKKDKVFLAPSDCEKILKALGVESYIPFDENAIYNEGNFKIKGVYADHTVRAIGLLITYKRLRLYFTGDTLYNEKLLDINCDYLFVCINGKLGNMNVLEAIRLTEKINPKVAIPNHYDMFESNSENPDNFMVKQKFVMEFNKEYDIEDIRAL